jgi:REP element-mobilizing transposase RayT
MRKVEAFTGVRVVTYCLMTNHVHLLLEVPNREAVSDAEMFRRLRIISSPAVFACFRQQWDRMVEQKSETALEEMRKAVHKRMFDVSAFMKELKLRFTLWYNRGRKRRGTIWEDRFKSTLVQGEGTYLATAAAYIDLNPVRAGLVEDPKDHRHCGYAEALAGNAEAIEGLAVITAAVGTPKPMGSRGTETVLARYRRLLFGKAAPTTRRAGVPAAAAEKVQQSTGSLPTWELARHRLRWLAEGAVIGSKAFVQDMRGQLRDKLGLKRAHGAYPADEDVSFCALRAPRQPRDLK